jgi:hypothetical protein
VVLEGFLLKKSCSSWSLWIDNTFGRAGRTGMKDEESRNRVLQWMSTLLVEGKRTNILELKEVLGG